MNPHALGLHWDFKPGLTFLNHGSFGVAPRELRQWRSRLLDQVEADPVAFMGAELQPALDASRQALAGLVGAEPTQLAFVPSTTYGLNQLLQRLELPVGSEILMADHGYNATTNLVAYAAEQRGWSLRLVTLPLDYPDATDDPSKAVAGFEAAWSPRTRLLVIDHITSPSALVLPLEQLVALARERGALVIVDGAHAPGLVPLDLAAWQRLGLEPDAYVGNLHKWLCCPRGSAFIWVRPPWQAKLRPLVVGHGANAPVLAGQSRFHLEHDWLGTFDPTPWLALPEALRLLEGQGPRPDLAGEGRLVLQESLQESFGMGFGLSYQPLDAPLAMLAFQLPPVGVLDGPALQRALLELGFQVPIIPLRPHVNGVAQFLRISCFAYNDLDDLQGLAAALPTLT